MSNRQHLHTTSNAALWFGLFGSPAIWFAALLVSYLFVSRACALDSSLVLHVVAALALAGSLFAGYTALRIWRAEGNRLSKDTADPADRSRFMAEIGVGSSALFSLLLLGQWVAIFVLGPCIPLPRVPFTPDALLSGTPVLLAHVGLPLAPHDLWRAWSTDPLIVLSLIWAGVFYGAGLRWAPRMVRTRAIAFSAGCAALAGALLSPLHAAAEVLFSAHMAQHTLIIAVAAPLIVLGRPVLVSLWALPRHTRRRVAQHRVSRSLAAAVHLTPGQAFLVHGVTLWLWHVPALYGAALQSGPLHALQHTSFFVTALVFWAALLDARRRGWTYGAGVFYVFATAVHTSVLGALIALANTPWYRPYLATTEVWGLTPLEDQQLAGLIMWVPAGLLYTLAALFLLAAWLRESEARARAARFAVTAAVALVFAACDGWPGVSLRAMDAATAATLTGGDPAAGRRAISQKGCGGCHTIRGVAGANGLVGPPLNGIGQRLYIAGVLPNDPQNMVRWITDPQAVDPLTVMPRLGVTPEQARDITAYLYTLK